MHCPHMRSVVRCVTTQYQLRSHERPSLTKPWCRRLTSSRSKRSTLRASADPAPAAAPASSVIASKRGDLVWASCVSSLPSVNAAVQEAVDSILEQQDDNFEPDLAIVFASCNYGSQLQDVVSAIRRQVPGVRHVFGCSAFGVLGSSCEGSVEVEGEPGVSLTLAALPGVDVSVMHTLRSSIPSEDASPEAWCDLVGMTPVEQLQQSTTSSVTATLEEDAGDQEQQQTQQQEQQQQEQQQQQLEPEQSVAENSSKEQQQVQEQGSVPGTTSSSSSSDPAKQQQPPSSAVSFLVLCDPRFQQSKELLAGLDFAFPTASKVGAVLSQGQQNKRRLMFVWSADGSVQTGTAAWRRQQRQRRQQQQQQQQQIALSSSCASQQVDQQQQQQQQHKSSLFTVTQSDRSNGQAESKDGKKKGLFGSLFDSLLFSLNDAGEQSSSSTANNSTNSSANTTSSQKPAEYEMLNGSSSSSNGLSAAADSSTSAAETSNSDSDSDEDDSSPDPGDHPGVFMYGAAVLSIKGPLLLEPITCQGYRTVSSKVWTVGQTSRDGDLIATLVDPDVDAADRDEGEDESEVVPMMALYELMAAAGADSAAPDELIEALSSRLAVAIAADTWLPISELQADDFQVCAISEVWQKTGYFRIDGQARPGYRLRMVLRDEQGIRDDLDHKLLGLKRAELAGVLSGDKQPQPLGVIMFSDIGRGSSLYDTPNYESGAVSKFLPAPLSGMFGSAQISTVNKKAGLYELATAVAVVRPLGQNTAESQQEDSKGVSYVASEERQEQ